ncbi:MAG: hypothetical protein E7110_04890 [Bacteroidales bacterium]|nr:hypothetical protein [Bacteroidales bacterium]MBQ8646304.1 hypothetical protein [Bacteroidales bacterium]
MKYFIRSVKYLVYFTVMCGIILVLTFHFSVKPEGLTLMDMLLVDGSIYKMLIFFVAVAAIYPALGFQKKEVYVSNFKEHKKEIIELFENANYVVASESATTISFKLRNPFLRLLRICEDYVTIDFSGNPILMEGLRKDILRFSRGIEYICRSEEEK